MIDQRNERTMDQKERKNNNGRIKGMKETMGGQKE